MKPSKIIPGIARVDATDEGDFWRDPLPIMELKNDGRWKKTMRWNRYRKLLMTKPDPYWRTLLKRAIDHPLFDYAMGVLFACWLYLLTKLLILVADKVLL